MRSIMIIAAASLFSLGGALAQEQEKTEVKPGNAPTKSVGEAVPTMKDNCPGQTGVDTKAPGTQATEATGQAVPTMKPEDCPPGQGTSQGN
jgi:hypothetical protein